jgi:hypothetical protein
MKLMAVDGHKDRREYVYILKVAYEMGMTQEDIASLTPDMIMHEQKLPADEKERMMILYYLLFMMKTDGIVTEDEELLVKDLGYHLGFRIDLVTDLVQVIKSYENMPSPSDALLDSIRKYLN